MASKNLFCFALLFSVLGCGLCWIQLDRGMMASSWHKVPPFKTEIEVMENPLVCEACTLLVEQLQKFLGNDSTEIINFLDGLCDELPADYVATCKEYVDQWTPIIVDFIEKETPKEICADLTLCTAGEPLNPWGGFAPLIRYFKARVYSQRMVLRTSMGNEFLCDSCNEVVDMLAEELTNPMIWDEIVALLSATCTLCPVPDQCRSFYESIPAQVTAFVDQYLNNQTCKILGLCTSSEKENPTDMFGRLVDAFLSGDMVFGGRRRPFSRPNPRPHPFRGWKPFLWFKNYEHDRSDEEASNSTEPMGNGTRPEGGRPHHLHHHHHEHGHHRGEWYGNGRPDRPSRPDRPDHGRRPGGRDPDHRPNRGPVHGFLPWGEDIPRPDVRPWWRPDSAKPFKPRPWGGKPVLPDEPEVEVEVPEVEIPEIPDVHIPEVPDFQIPEVDAPEQPNLDFQPPAELGYPAPKNPFDFDGRREPTVNDPWKHRKVSWSKRKWAGTRKQRSVRIETELNTGDFDPTNIFDIEPAQKPVQETVTEVEEKTWQCEACETQMEILQTYLKSHQDAIQEKLMSLADALCENLPEGTADECKAEMEDVVPSLVEMGIEKLNADFVCTDIFKFC